MKEETLNKILKITEEFFGTQDDPEQIPINKDSCIKLYSLHPDSFLYKLDEKGEPIAWTVVIPTSLDIMNHFLKKEISERQLFDTAITERKYGALYLCSAFVIPKYRQKGYAKVLLAESIQKIESGSDVPLYCWIYTVEGQRLVQALSKDLGREIKVRV